jgi:uroporphyrinogen-III decarboxylase
MMGKREAVKAILEGKGADRIPVIMNIVSLSADRYGYSMLDIMMDPAKFAECTIGTRRKLGYDGMCGGIMMGPAIWQDIFLIVKEMYWEMEKIPFEALKICKS